MHAFSNYSSTWDIYNRAITENLNTVLGTLF